MHPSDKVVVSRAELIVSAHLKAGSIDFISNPWTSSHPPISTDPSIPGYRSPGGSHRMELLISEVLKGSVLSNSIVIYVSGTLIPVIGGYSTNELGQFIYEDTNCHCPDMVQLYDHNTQVGPENLFTGDIRTNHIWLLHRDVWFPLATDRESRFATNGLWIFDPEDVQPLSKREQLIRLLQ